MGEGECTCNIAMMADHNAMCDVCFKKLIKIDKSQTVQVTDALADECTCTTMMMADHNAMCEPCSRKLQTSSL